MAVEIREAEEEDAELLAEDFWLPLAREMEDYHEVNELDDDAGETAVDGFQDRLEDGKYRFFFLELDGEEVGYVSLERGERETREHGKCIAIVGIFVKEGFRGEGYGTRLMEKAREYAEELDADYIVVEAEWDNSGARKFYSEKDFDEKKVRYVKMLE
ncbi:MAG: GNAT family N-acetyltransferase [Candidatus Nanohalobium sp.]